MSGPQYPGPGPEGQQPQYGQSDPSQPRPPQYGAPDQGGGYPPPAGQYPPPGQYGQPGSYPPPPPVGQSPYEQGIYSTTGQPAGAGIRLGARIIDGIIVAVPVVIIETVVGVVAGNIAYYIASLILSFAGIAYFTYLESTRGATFGKQLLKLKTVGPDGNPPSQNAAFKRSIWLLLSVLSSLLGFIFFLPFLVGVVTLGVLIAIGVTINNDPNKQGVHDKFAGGTRVVKV